MAGRQPQQEPPSSPPPERRGRSFVGPDLKVHQRECRRAEAAAPCRGTRGSTGPPGSPGPRCRNQVSPGPPSCPGGPHVPVSPTCTCWARAAELPCGCSAPRACLCTGDFGPCFKFGLGYHVSVVLQWHFRSFPSKTNPYPTGSSPGEPMLQFDVPGEELGWAGGTC